MTTVIKRVACAALLALLLANQGFAADTGGVKVGGSVRSTVVVNQAVNIANGPGAKAGLSVGAVHGGTRTKGSIRQSIFVNRIFNLSEGSGSPACVKVGSYGHNPACR